MNATYTPQQAAAIQAADQFLRAGFGTMRQVTEALSTALGISTDEAHKALRAEIDK